ncbi:MAG: radical SAM protein [Myxococcales bacterium]|nr:radical SAM protein [Myxococcales bacterium]MCB9534123.1 radical SAM protein [Myxococcales bacterium]
MDRPIVVVQPPLRISSDVVDYPYHADLAVVQAAAVLRAADLPTVVIDALALPSSVATRLADGQIELGAPVDALNLSALEDPSVFIVHYSVFHRPPSRDALLGDVLSAIRTAWPTAAVVLADLYQSGEHYIKAAPRDILASYPEADVFLQFQAELVLADLCSELRDAGRPATQRAVIGPEVVDLSTLPIPAWDLVDLDARDRLHAQLVEAIGRGGWAFPIDGRTLPAITSRGCPYKCAHCSSNPDRAEGAPKRQRRPSPERVTALVDALVEQFGATRIDVLDEMVNVDGGHFDNLLTSLARHDVRYDFPNGMRADWVTEAHLDAMAGRIATLSVSAESGVQRVVDQVVDKRLDLEAIERTVAGASKRGISTLVHFIIGMPGETRREINQTLDYAVHLYSAYGAWPGVQFATPLPGTRLADRADAAARAQGAALPQVADYSPLFQHSPSTWDEEFTPEDLRRFKWTFDQRIQAGNEPTKVIMNVTYRCNNRCNFCAVGNRSFKDGRFEDQQKLLRNYRARGLHQVDFDGGEPTLYPQLVQLVRYARAIGYTRINVTTNGRMCSYDSYARRLVQSGLTTLLFSVHGHDQATHARNVGVAEAYEQTITGIRNCVAHRPDHVELGMNVTVTKSNAEDLPHIAQLAWDLGVRWLNVQFLTPFGRATTRVNPDTAAAAAIAMRVIDQWRDRMKFQVINLPFCFMPGYEEFILGDLLKIQRHMVFVNNEDVNLFDYLRDRRTYAPECEVCPHRVFCGGFYELENSPEPPWEFEYLEVDEVQA